jgi:hypothetical protein
MKRCIIEPPIKLPSWFGGVIHGNHQIALVYKAHRRAMHEHRIDELEWYARLGWHEIGDYYREDLDANLPFQHYYWPVR